MCLILVPVIRMCFQRSLHDSRNKGVVYASLDMVAMSAVEHIREEHKDVRNFEDLLQRHDLREEEMNRRRGKVSTSHDQ